jgi:hypothetical protein
MITIAGGHGLRLWFVATIEIAESYRTDNQSHQSIYRYQISLFNDTFGNDKYWCTGLKLYSY